MASIKNKYRKRWFAYFDLLGFSELVRNNPISKVLQVYEMVLKSVQQEHPDDETVGISQTWFSDTFILYTRGSSEHEFAKIEMASRLFFQRLILKEIPVRGALTVGPVYTNRSKNTYVGKGLIDAYEYGEDQNWLGFILTPSVFKHLSGSTIPINQRAFYRKIDASVLKKKSSSNVYAFTFDNGRINGKNPFLNHLNNMKIEVDDKIKIKYENTENFIEKHMRQRT
ncbi:hypothetical protein [Methylophaga lonarensis]|uniref:hypothetical protein n=1 Tax=Methylophaga lonarensis TaxID=999151 RepID=UPI0012674ECE|nr:hypothetical protein [Methylophaga lonarensis]